MRAEGHPVLEVGKDERPLRGVFDVFGSLKPVGPQRFKFSFSEVPNFLLTQLSRCVLACMRAESVSPASWPTCV